MFWNTFKDDRPNVFTIISLSTKIEDVSSHCRVIYCCKRN